MEVSNLPSVSEDFTSEELHRKLQDLALENAGSVEKVSIAQGTALVKFPSAGQANEFKRRYVNYRINGRPINIHNHYNFHGRTRSRSRGGSGGVRRSSSHMRIRTLSGMKVPLLSVMSISRQTLKARIKI